MAINKNEIYKMDKDFIYTGERTNQISFPIGGIGTGSIGLAGNGRLIDWEIFNRPNKNSYNGFSFFAIKAECEGQVKVAKVLNGDLNAPYSGSSNKNFRGFGFGVDRESMAGFPHFKSTTFKGEYPFAEIDFEDDHVPLDVKLTAFNPLIPLNDKDSSLPVAVFTFEVTNKFQDELDISLVGCLTNPFTKGSVNQYSDFGRYRGIKLSSQFYKENEPEFGDLFISTNGEDVSYQSYWYRGGWFDNLTIFWKEFSAPGQFNERNYDTERDGNVVATYNYLDVCSLSNKKTLKPGERGEFQFLISWNFPNYVNYWNPGNCCCDDDRDSSCQYPSWKNYYATLFEDSTKSAKYLWENYERLLSETMEFKETLFHSSLPDHVIDAISSNISILKSPTCIRLTDGTLYGFEGCHAEEGCCEGSCTHVWNYEQVTPFLFPKLARSMRVIDYNSTLFNNGYMAFRMMVPANRTLEDYSESAPPRAAADGQMGGIIKVYREWKISGDTHWLNSIWPKVKKALEYAWEPTNPDFWDKDCDGVMEGIQHHTLDVEIYGPNSYISGLYHTALLAASKMADALGDEDGKKYLELYKKGQKWVDENLFNGEYFYQKIDLTDPNFPIDPELGESKYQIGEGCHIDQVLGQWHSHIVGLGYIFEKDKVKKALNSIYNNNFVTPLRDYPNACRIYGLNDEQALLICTWPKGNSPKVPVPYADECMNGFEYQAACHMIYEGLLDEGINVVKAIRHRYDGRRRNPWNEFECGSNYARSMASFSLLLSLSGFEYDMVDGYLGFSPKINQEDFTSFWSLNTGWGEYSQSSKKIELKVKYGHIRFNQFRCALLQEKNISKVFVGDKSINFDQKENMIHFSDAIHINKGESLTLL